MILAALWSICLIYALPREIQMIPVQTLLNDKPSISLRQSVLELSHRGFEIYYYSETQVLVSALPTHPQATKLKLHAEGALYLVNKYGPNSEADLNAAGNIVADLGTSWLLQSALDEVKLRKALANPFSQLELTPMVLQRTSTDFEAMKGTRTEIEDLVNSVSQDSITYFLQSLQDFQTRYALADNRLAVATWIKNQFLRFGIADAQLFPFQWQGTTQYNVVATIPGTISPDSYIVVGGHHDSITNNTPLTSAPGADDNATGSVAAIEMARVMMQSGYQPKCSIRFMTFAAEEFGLWGAKAYAQYADDNDMDIQLMINHDMLANTSPNPTDLRVRLMPYDGFYEYTDYAMGITDQYTDLIPVYGSANSSSSDSFPFWQRGFPVIYFFEYNFSQVYHSDNDTMANLDPAYCTKVIKASTAVAASFAGMPTAPTALNVQDAGTGNALIIGWTASTDPFVTGYRVYYQPQGSTDPQVQSTSASSLVLTGLTQGITYDISVCAIDAFGMESTRIFGSGTPNLLPLEPVGFTDEPALNAINLSWEGNMEADLIGYYLYRSNAPDQLGTQVGVFTANTNTYADSNVNGTQGYYYYSLCAVDQAGNISPYANCSSRPVTLNQGVLIVDETADYNGTNPLMPTDEMVDSFYDEIMQGFQISEHLDLANQTEFLRLADIGVYSSILWHGNDSATMSYPYEIRDDLKRYIELGGKVLFSVYRPSNAFELSATYPATFAPTSFISEVLGISGADLSNSARFKLALPIWTNLPSMMVDSLKTTAAMNGHIFKVEAITPVVTGDQMYLYGSAYDNGSAQGEMNGDPVAVFNEYGSGKTVTLSFPLYNMELPGARAFTVEIFSNQFAEPLDAEDPTSGNIPALSIFSNYPNPFSSSTYLPLSLQDKHNTLLVQIYNTKGQLVKTIFNDSPGNTSLLNWDGKDDRGNAVSSGIYFAKASQNGRHSTRKIMLMK